jgi:L-aspartate oxidase
MKDADPRAELASRDIVARAIDKELKTSGEDCVYLDISHKDKDYLISRFPTIYKKLLSYGIDLTKEPIPVVPAAHYSCGGVWTDDLGRTSLPNLLSAGEVACTGLHGANRLASNSLLEAVVFARRATTYAQSIIANIPSPRDLPQWDDLDTSKSEEEVLIDF